MAVSSVWWGRQINKPSADDDGSSSMIESGCEKCWSSDAASAFEAVTKIPIEEHLVDESHFMVSIRRCKNCLQRYLQITTEQIDWKGGEDSIFRTFVSINDDERTQLMGEIPLPTRLLELVGLGKRSLKYDWPSDQEPSVYWSSGVNVGAHD